MCVLSVLRKEEKYVKAYGPLCLLSTKTETRFLFLLGPFDSLDTKNPYLPTYLLLRALTDVSLLPELLLKFFLGLCVEEQSGFTFFSGFTFGFICNTPLQFPGLRFKHRVV